LSGVLHLVGTPIGNLEDITLRALRTLREADRIACEDTRRTRKLLAHFEIRKPLLSCHEHNEAARAQEIVALVEAGEKVALVSDAGMPTISDPGYRVVRAAVEAGLRVEPIPGPTAVETALAASGLPPDTYCFRGFLPARSAKRRRELEAAAEQSATLIYYEAPHRIIACLEDLRAAMGEREVVIARELTKTHEEFLRGTVSEVLYELSNRAEIKGEITLLVGRAATPIVSTVPDAESLAARVAELLSEGLSRMDAIKQAAREAGLHKRDAYRLLEENARK
jgi:16S rRNA (cytidine1402-2'-O)-methyltransferase